MGNAEQMGFPKEIATNKGQSLSPAVDPWGAEWQKYYCY